MATIVVLAVIAVAAFVAVRGGDDATTTTSQGPPVELSHIHGLGVDPADGQLYAGTHYGLIRVGQDDTLERVGGVVQDFMGFTVVGAKHYLASGHPGEGQNGPHNLGLIESTDGGKTWQTVSLEGEGDFHALEAKHGRVYGYHGGQLMVSEDGKTWDTRGRIAMADFAVSTAQPDTLLATTQQGLVRSVDGGRTFSAVAGAPLLQLVTWSSGENVIGVAPDGSVQVSADGGSTWEERGSTGAQPHALTAEGDAIYVALEQSVVRSVDGGRTFTTVYGSP